jgi:hypothetical protein
VDNWLVHVLGEKPDSIKPALFEYLGLVGRFWLLGMVYRVMEPGCKFDYCPVLEGSGGLRKSTLVETLATSEYFSDTPFEVGKGKEAQEQVQGLWLYEIAELTHFSKSEVGAIKAFISAKVDRYRVAYGTTVESFPRQCVLVGTTNEDTYLRDRTGNRRFWPIPVKRQINTEFVAKYREQLLALAFLDRDVFSTQAELDAAVAAGTARPCPLLATDDDMDMVRAGILLTLGDLFANREEVVTGTITSQLPTGAKACLLPLRRLGA